MSEAFFNYEENVKQDLVELMFAWYNVNTRHN